MEIVHAAGESPRRRLGVVLELAALLAVALGIPGMALAQDAGSPKLVPAKPAAAPTKAPAQGLGAPAKPPVVGRPPTKPRPPRMKILPGRLPLGQRWTGATPEEMALLNVRRARHGKADAVAGLLIAHALDERAHHNLVRNGLASVASGRSSVADDARWLGFMLRPVGMGKSWPGSQSVTYDTSPSPNGLVRNYSVLGPFQDSGGGLKTKEGPESSPNGWTDTSARYSWGAYDVSWHRTLPKSSSARGVPLDLYVHPREESCTYLASIVTLAPTTPGPVRMLVAATGSVRVLWDGADVGTSEDVHRSLVLDRMAFDIEAQPGPHLVSLKVCSSSVADQGRVRVRFTDGGKTPVKVSSSSSLSKGGWTPSTTADAVKRVPTTLEKALDIPPDPSVEQALVASIVRTFGGADDTRSTRAPGLLDRVAKDASISPDVMAITGWVSPYGANRSGWLNQAWERAAKKGDKKTASFAQRRLVAAHLGSGMPEWALALMRKDPLHTQQDSEAKLIRAAAKRAHGGAGLAQSALDDLLALQARLGSKTPLNVIREIASLSRGRPKIALDAYRRIASKAAEARGPGYVYAHRFLGAEAMERTAARVLDQQTSAAALVGIGRGLFDLGRYEWARETLYVATDLSPNHGDAFALLASARRARAAEQRRQGEETEDPRIAQANLRRSLDLEPGDVRAKAELAFRTLEKGDSATQAKGSKAKATAMRDEQYLVPADVIVARARKQPAKVGEHSDRQLHWVRVVTYHSDKRVSQLMHYSREIVIEPRTQHDLDERDVPSEGDTTELLFARVHRVDGTVAEPEEVQVGGSRPYIRWPDLKRGDIVEVAVRSWTAEPVGRRGDAPYYFIDYVGGMETRPILYNEVVVDSPKDSPLAIDVLGGKPDRVENLSEGGREIHRFIWDNPPKIADEPFAPRLAESVPVVVGSTYAGWGGFREWYREAVKGFTEPDDQVKRLAQELTKGKRTRDEKIEALFNFVADDIRYVNYQSGEWWLPNRPQELLARRQGDCDDKAMLLISLLKVVGVEATPVLVQTRHTALPTLLSSTKAAIPVFDHGIAYIPGKGDEPGIWLDATSPESRMGPLPAMDARARAFFIEDGEPKIIATPASDPSHHGVDAKWTIRLDASGAGDLVAKETHRGDSAFYLRMNLRQEDARAQWVERFMASGWFPTLEVKPDVDFREEKGGRAFLGYQARSEGFARREGTELAVPVSPVSTLTSKFAPLVKRTLPVVLPPSVAPGHHTAEIEIIAPKGFVFADLPPSGNEEAGEFGHAELEFRKVSADRVQVTRSMTFDMSTISVAKYAQWRSWLQRVDGMLHRVVRLVPEKGR